MSTGNFKILYFVLGVLLLTRCSSDEFIKKYDKTVVVYMVADNNLEAESLNSLNQMEKGLPNNDCNLIVYADINGEPPKLLKIIKDNGNNIVSKVIKVYPEQNSSDSKVLNSVLSEIKLKYLSKTYGLILWSHGTAWLPSNFSNKSYSTSKLLPNYLKTRSFGQDTSNEMDIKELAKDLPTGFDYLIFDACLMGSVEVCYELKDKVPYVLASSLESLAEGFPYQKVTPLLFKDTELKEKLISVGKTYFNYYNSKQGVYQSAGIALIYTPELQNLALKNKQLITANPLPLWKYNQELVQKLDAYQNTIMYDYLDFLKKNYPSKKLNNLEQQLNKTIIYKAHTSSFLNMYKINQFCGLSCYIPKKSNTYLNTYYLGLNWAKDSNFNLLIK